jgi:uncharacterized protein YndB with AHSA1/START domain
MKGLVARQSIVIQAPPARVWKALTDPALIKEYLFGTKVSSDWKAGSQIRYRGVWEGKSYEDKGIVLKAEPRKVLESTYWSSMSGLPDVPENYKVVRYELTPEQGGTRLTVTQDNNATEAERDHSERNWKMVLEGLKELVEKMEKLKGE